MTIIEFAEKHKLKVRRDPDDGTDIIPGTHDQSHIYEWNKNELAVIFITPSTKPARPFFWRKHRTSAIAAGMRVIQDGDAEGCMGFDPARPDQVKIALKLAGVKRTRQVSQEQLATLARFRFAPRKAA
jgi:hypothetical protein